MIDEDQPQGEPTKKVYSQLPLAADRRQGRGWQRL